MVSKPQRLNPTVFEEPMVGTFFSFTFFFSSLNRLKCMLKISYHRLSLRGGVGSADRYLRQALFQEPMISKAQRLNLTLSDEPMVRCN